MEKETRPFYTSQNILATLDDNQKLVLEEAKAALVKESLALPDELLAWFVLSKKTLDKIIQAVSQYIHWLTLLDYSSISWDYIEYLLRLPVLLPPYSSDNLFGLAKDGSIALYMNSINLDPKFAGARLITATLWLVVHFLLSKTQALSKKMTMCGQMCDVGWSKFYPQIQRPVLDAMQCVLPVRFARMILVDPPFVFWLIFEIIQLWLSAKFKERLITCSSKDVQAYIEKEQLPPFIKGGKKEIDTESLISEMKLFFEQEFKPTVSLFVADQPKKVPDMSEELWNPSKEFNSVMKKKLGKTEKQEGGKKKSKK